MRDIFYKLIIFFVLCCAFYGLIKLENDRVKEGNELVSIVNEKVAKFLSGNKPLFHLKIGSKLWSVDGNFSSVLGFSSGSISGGASNKATIFWKQSDGVIYNINLPLEKVRFVESDCFPVPVLSFTYHSFEYCEISQGANVEQFLKNYPNLTTEYHLLVDSVTIKMNSKYYKSMSGVLDFSQVD